ncbi:site-specific integrase [Alphaproteobacteria bacterium]|nr:site-specific integrase [Alphaproteobacteria bacterium]
MSKKFETEQQDMLGDGRIVLYQRADSNGNAWQARIKVEGRTGYLRFSTKKTELGEAKNVALERFTLESSEDKRSVGTFSQSRSFSSVFKKWQEDYRVSKRNRTKQFVELNIRRIEMCFLEKFKTTDIRRISAGDYSRVLNRHMVKIGATSDSTAYYYRFALAQMLDWAYRNKLMRERVELETISSGKERREEFSKSEWKRLYKHMRDWVDGAKTNQRDRFYLQHYVLILGNTGMRIGEARTLRWRDLDYRTNSGGSEDLLMYVSGKTGDREVVANSGTELYVKRLFDYRIKELGISEEDFISTRADEFLFCHKDGTSVGSFKKGFRNLLEECGLLKGKNGKNRSLYSIRHTYARFRIEDEVAIYDLASNMGTSVKMIERFYLDNKMKSEEFARRMKRGNQTSSKSSLAFLTKK